VGGGGGLHRAVVGLVTLVLRADGMAHALLALRNDVRDDLPGTIGVSRSERERVTASSATGCGDSAMQYGKTTPPHGNRPENPQALLE
jgi:hypothetical protein